jgi:hypothetical protein
MKTNTIIRAVRKVTTTALIAGAAMTLSNCASTNHALTRHDMDGDGAISHAEYQQGHARYNMSMRERVDEHARVRLAVNHMDSIGDFIGEASQATYLLRNFGH